MIADALESSFSLLVMGERTATTLPLASGHTIVIGTDAACDVRLEGPAIAGRHAVLHIGPPQKLEVLSGTARIGELSVPAGQTALVEPGQVITLGGAMLVVQRRGRAQARRIWSHDNFEVRLEEQCIRAERFREQFVLLRLRTLSPVSALVIETVLTASLRLTDIIGQWGPNQYEVILTETTAEDSRIVFERMLTAFSAEHIEVRLGAAAFPRDGISPDALAGAAADQLRGPEEPKGPPTLGPTMQALHSLVERVAQSTLSVLLLGETGAGKERLAELVHALSPRREKPFLRLNCAALTETLLESELFGHERGAFTGAVATKLGLLETAEGGTVFLDEVGELPLATQVKLLRVIEERQVMHVGGLKPRGIDVRFVSATNRDLELEIRRGAFREDLFFRVAGVTLSLPPLRERQQEIKGLALNFIEVACKRDKRPVPTLSTAALQLFMRYHWPGNVRELRNVIERAVLLSTDGVIELAHLPVEKMSTTFVNREARPGPRQEKRLADSSSGTRRAIGDEPMTPSPLSNAPHLSMLLPRPSPVRLPPGAPTARPSAPPAPAPSAPVMPDLGANAEEWQRSLEALEKKRFLLALEQCAGNQTAAAKQLGVSRRTLLQRLDAWGVARPRKGRS